MGSLTVAGVPQDVLRAALRSKGQHVVDPSIEACHIAAPCRWTGRPRSSIVPERPAPRIRRSFLGCGRCGRWRRFGRPIGPWLGIAVAVDATFTTYRTSNPRLAPGRARRGGAVGRSGTTLIHLTCWCCKTGLELGSIGLPPSAIAGCQLQHQQPPSIIFGAAGHLPVAVCGLVRPRRILWGARPCYATRVPVQPVTSVSSPCPPPPSHLVVASVLCLTGVRLVALSLAVLPSARTFGYRTHLARPFPFCLLGVSVGRSQACGPPK